jgi:hypothetical protein
MHTAVNKNGGNCISNVICVLYYTKSVYKIPQEVNFPPKRGYDKVRACQMCPCMTMMDVLPGRGIMRVFLNDWVLEY